MCIVLNLLITSLILAVATENCTTPNNKPGECISLFACPQLADGLGRDPIGHFEFVRQSKCGGDANDPYVCCGKAANFTQSQNAANTSSIETTTHFNKWQQDYVGNIPLASDFLNNIDKGNVKPLQQHFSSNGGMRSRPEDSCTTFNGVKGTCTPLYTCPVLLRAYADPLRGLEEYYLKYRCRNIDTYICCEPAWYSAQALADRSSCGLQRTNNYPSLTDKSRTSSIDEFPWLAAIIVPKLDRNVCQGVVINVRYVLTAAHCFISPEYERNDVTSVRLGGYHLKNTKYCFELSQYDATDCATTEEFGVEEIILHPLYFESIGINDLALIRLDRTITFTDFIQPICLPIPGTEFAKPGDTLYTTGWGKISHGGERAHVKKKIMATLIDSKECEARLKITPVPITPLHMCTVDFPNNTESTCEVAGAPVMFAHNNQWHIEGIVSKSLPWTCKFPQVATTISQYLAWIKQNIRLHDV